MARLFVFGQPTLHGLDGVADTDGVWLELPREPVFFGRTAPYAPGERRVQLAFNFVARRHFVIEPVDDGWQLRDLGSSGGTWVNRQRATPAVRLNDGDVINLKQRIGIFRNENGGGR